MAATVTGPMVGGTSTGVVGTPDGLGDGSPDEPVGLLGLVDGSAATPTGGLVAGSSSREGPTLAAAPMTPTTGGRDERGPHPPAPAEHAAADNAAAHELLDVGDEVVGRLAQDAQGLGLHHGVLPFFGVTTSDSSTSGRRCASARRLRLRTAPAETPIRSAVSATLRSSR